jgi:hypothetical protein
MMAYTWQGEVLAVQLDELVRRACAETLLLGKVIVLVQSAFACFRVLDHDEKRAAINTTWNAIMHFLSLARPQRSLASSTSPSAIASAWTHVQASQRAFLLQQV